MDSSPWSAKSFHVGIDDVAPPCPTCKTTTEVYWPIGDGFFICCGCKTKISGAELARLKELRRTETRKENG